MVAEWSGGVFDCCDDGTVCALSATCTFCVFGWNMERLGFGNMYVHAFTFILLCIAPFLIFSVTALNIHDQDVRDTVVAVGVLRLLEAVRICHLEHKCRIYQASTSELFGKVEEVPQKETTPFHPRSPYSVAKLYGFWIMKNYKEAYGMYCCNGILFNHESERRGENFVTRKITLAASRIVQGYQDKLYLGNLDSLRDWGYAKDYVECMWMILQQPEPDDYVIATGEYHTVREFCTLAFHHAGIDLEWQGKGLDEKGIDKKTGKVLVEVDPKYFRPAEVEQLLGDPTKAKTVLGWNPRKTSFEDLVKIMVDHDMKFVKKLYLKAQLPE